MSKKGWWNWKRGLLAAAAAAAAVERMSEEEINEGS